MLRCPFVALEITVTVGLVLLFSNGILSALKNSEICGEVPVRKPPGALNYLNAEPYIAFGKMGFLECQEACYKYTTCKSINYNMAKRFCKLMKTNWTTERKRPIYKEGFMYLDRADFNKNITPACRKKKCPEQTVCTETKRSGVYCRITFPYFEIEPETRTHVNTNTSLTCKASGLNIRYRWTELDLTPIGQGDRNGTYVHSDNPGELTLHLGGFQNPGTRFFYCFAKNDAGQDKIKGRVYVYYHPDVKLRKTTPASSGGSILNLTCTSTSPLPTDMNLYKYDEALENSTRLRGKSMRGSTPRVIQVIIANPSTGDLGTYYCHVTTEIDDVKVEVNVVSEDLVPGNLTNIDAV